MRNKTGEDRGKPLNLPFIYASDQGIAVPMTTGAESVFVIKKARSDRLQWRYGLKLNIKEK